MSAQDYNAQFAWTNHFGGGLAPKSCDNPFGGLDPATRQFEVTTVAFQHMMGIDDDGYFGPNTLEKYREMYGAPSLCVHGVDVSGHQKHAEEEDGVDFDLLRQQGFEFAIVKATEGVGKLSRRCLEHARGVRDAGMALGFYTYATPFTNGEFDAQAECESFVRHLEQLGDYELKPALDIEDKGYKVKNGSVVRGAEIYRLYKRQRELYIKRMTDWISAWVDRFVELTGEYPLLYTYPSFLRRFVLTDKIARCPLWLAAYVLEDPRERYDVDSRWELACQQFTSDGDERSRAVYDRDLDLNRAPWGLGPLMREHL